MIDNLLISINHKVFTKLKLHYPLFSSQNYVNYNHLPKNPQIMTMNLPSTASILDKAQYRLFRTVRSDILSTDAKTHFIKLNFINKGIDAVDLASILEK